MQDLRQDTGSETIVTRSDEADIAPELGRSLIQALTNTGISVLYQDLQYRLMWFHNLPAAWAGGENWLGRIGDDFLPESEAARTMAAKKLVFSAGAPQNLEICVPDAHGPRWFNIWVNADRSDDGAIQGFVTTAVDTTEQRRREQTLRALLREVSHRSKNLLAIIQSVATQTGRYSGTIEGFLTRFRGRLQSLSSSQDLVTSSNWRGAQLHELAVGQIGRYCNDPGKAIRFVGKDPLLNPNAALHIGLAFHELAVNSVSYGALSRAEGAITIASEFKSEPDGHAPSLSLLWTEDVPDADASLAEKRFGSVALERVVPASLNGQAWLSISGRTLQYRLVMPAGSFEID